MQIGDSVALAISGWRNVMRGTVTKVLDNGKVEVGYCPPGSTFERVCTRWPSEIIVLKD